MTKVKTMQDLFVDELQDLYDAENQIVKALPKMIKAASSQELKRAFEDHLETTRKQVERLDRIFAGFTSKPTGRKCLGMRGLLEESEEVIGEGIQSSVRDAGLIGAAQKVEHYEIAGYGTARTFAEMLGHTEAVMLLEETLKEEKAANGKLGDLAWGRINDEAMQTQGA